MSKHNASSSTGAARFVVGTLFLVSVLLILTYNMWVGVVVFLVAAAIEMRYVLSAEGPSGDFPDETMEPLVPRDRQV